MGTIPSHLEVKVGNKSNLEGKQFSRLVVIKELPIRSKSRHVVWLCRCDCGVYVDVPSTALVSGNTKSCGCLNIDKIIGRNTTHGLSHSPLYSVYFNMKKRCHNTESKDYKFYGGRGITICDRWLENITCFAEDMTQEYAKGLQIDRRDNDKGYSKENCRWITLSQNQQNTRGVKGSTSIYKGVSWINKYSKWYAQIKKQGKVYKLGFFDSQVDAANAYNKKALELNGEYAYLNKIIGGNNG